MYQLALDMYAAGRYREALEELLASGAQGLRAGASEMERLNEAAQKVQRLSESAQNQAAVAAMLHTDAVDVLWRHDRSLAMRHLNLARRWAGLTSMAPGVFGRRWYLAAGLLLTEHGSRENDVGPALAHFDMACRAIEGDVPLLTTAAWLEERTALAPAVWNSRSDPFALRVRSEKTRYLEKASGRLVAALAVEPLAPQPALRLGRIRMVLGDVAGARSALEPLLERPELPPSDAYLTRLFLGRALEQSGETTRAGVMYGDAIARVPHAASARLALARLLYLDGDGGAAIDALDPALVARDGPDDPWAEYLVRNLEIGARLRDELRRAVSS